MDLASYQSITGITVASADETRVTAEIARSRRKLEGMLGYTLDSAQRETNLYNELGKTDSDYSCPIVNLDNLLAPDAVQGAYRLYNFNPLDVYQHVDPFTQLYSVKLVYVKQGASPNGVTIKTFDDEYIRSHHSVNWSKYIQDFRGLLPQSNINFSWLCSCNQRHHYQLAVDAEWGFTDIPDDLLDVWADMVTYYANDSRNLKSEDILTHSYTKFDSDEYTTAQGTVKVSVGPHEIPRNRAIIQKYAGPRGFVTKETIA